MGKMGLVVDQDSLKTNMVATTVLVFLHWVVCSKQGSARAATGARAPEDGKLGGSSGSVTQDFSLNFNTEAVKDKTLLEKAARYDRMVMNNLESIPIGLVIVWCTLLCADDPIAHIVLVTIYAGARVCYSICYAYALQPFRSIVFILGLLSSIGLVVNGLVGVFR
eukprot:c10780_g1_i1.p1 GENE.c10780_g1_i1~~c10780_g1_i1.p1  ORF type:complete len:165 (-),score=39.60 c10780_g1_i1:90-584(-)